MKVLTQDEFEEAFKSHKRNKAGHDGLDVNITSVYELYKKATAKDFQ